MCRLLCVLSSAHMAQGKELQHGRTRINGSQIPMSLTEGVTDRAAAWPDELGCEQKLNLVC